MNQDRKSISRLARLVMITAGLFLVAWLFWNIIHVVLTPVLIALIIALILSPCVRKLEEKMPRGLAVAAAYLLLIAIVVILIAFVLPPLFHWVTGIGEKLPSIIENMKGKLMQIQQQLTASGIPNNLGTQLGDQITSIANNFSGMLGDVAGFISGIVSVIATIAIAFYFSVLFLTDREKLSGHMIFLLPQKYHKLARRTWVEITKALKRFLGAQGLIALLSFAGTVTFYYIFGLGYPLSLGVFMGICSLIPYIGPVIGAVPALVVALIEGKLLWIAVSIFTVQQVLAVFGPGILGDSLDIHPVYIILALLACGSLLGFWGMLLAIPISLIIKILVRNVYCEIVQRKSTKTFE